MCKLHRPWSTLWDEMGGDERVRFCGLGKLNKSGRCGQRRPTPAMAEKLTGHVWSFAELFETVTPAKIMA